MVIQRASQLNNEQLFWQPPDGGWTLWKMLHHLASSEILYSIWFVEPLPEEPITRYVEANRRLIDRAEQILNLSLENDKGIIDNTLSVTSPDKILLDILQLEQAFVAG